jgi:hypothetical protein
VLKACKINSLSCELRDSIVIWNKEIINNCLFKVIKNITVTIPYNDIIHDELNDQAYKVIAKETACENNIFRLSNGLFMINSNLTNITDYNGEIINTLEFAMADSDGVELKIFSMLDALKYELCTLHNKFTKFTSTSINKNYIMLNNNTQPIIIYHHDGIYVLPKCRKLNEIIIMPYNKTTVDPLINFVNNGTTYSGYLKENNIISRLSENSNVKEWIRSFNSGKLIIKITHTDVKLQYLNKTTEYFSYETLSNNLNFKHDKIILENDMYDKIIKDFETKDINNFEISGGVEDSDEFFLSMIKNKLFSHFISLIIVIPAVAVISVFITVKCYKKINKKSKKSKEILIKKQTIVIDTKPKSKNDDDKVFDSLSLAPDINNL